MFFFSIITIKLFVSNISITDKGCLTDQLISKQYRHWRCLLYATGHCIIKQTAPCRFDWSPTGCSAAVCPVQTTPAATTTTVKLQGCCIFHQIRHCGVAWPQSEMHYCFCVCGTPWLLLARQTTETTFVSYIWDWFSHVITIIHSVLSNEPLQEKLDWPSTSCYSAILTRLFVCLLNFWRPASCVKAQFTTRQQIAGTGTWHLSCSQITS